MRKKLKSWRWKRLSSQFALKQIGISEFILKLLCPLVVVYVLAGTNLLEVRANSPMWEVVFLEVFCVVVLLICGLMVFESLAPVCMAEETYEVKFNGKKADLFIYRLTPFYEKALYELVVVVGKETVYQNFVTDYFVTNVDEKFRNVIFEEDVNSSWFIIHEDGVQKLGVKIQKNVFLKSQDDEPKPWTNVKLCIVTANGYEVVNADFFVDNNNLYIPQGAMNFAVVKEGGMFVDAKFSKTLPDEYLLIKTNGSYHFLGIYYSGDAKKYPFFQEMLVDNAIFREGLDSIILSRNVLNNPKDYTVLYRKVSSSIHFNENLLIEMTDNEKRIGRFSYWTGGQLNTIYDGVIYCIDFVNHQIVGAGGKFYR